MHREGDQSDHVSTSGALASTMAFQPAPLAQRPGTLATTVLNPALSEDLVSRPMRPPLPALLKEGALRTVSKEITESGKEIDVGIEENAKLVLDEIMHAFLTDVVQEACKLAKRKRTNIVHGRDLGVVMNKRYGLNIPGSGGGLVMPTGQGGAANNEHNKRMAAIRKINAQAKRQRYR